MRKLPSEHHDLMLFAETSGHHSFKGGINFGNINRNMGLYK